MAFLETLPTPVTLIGPDGQSDISGREGPGYASINFVSSEKIQHTILPSSRYEMSRAATPHIWKVDISYNELLCAHFHVIYPFLLRKQESMQPFYIELPQYFNQGVTNRPVSAAGGWGYNTIVIDAGTVSVSPGSVFTCPFEKLYVVTRVETSTDYNSTLGTVNSGKERLHVSPTFQDTVSTGNLNFESPKLKVRLVDELTYSVKANNLYSFSLSVEEIR